MPERATVDAALLAIVEEAPLCAPTPNHRDRNDPPPPEELPPVSATPPPFFSSSFFLRVGNSGAARTEGGVGRLVGF